MNNVNHLQGERNLLQRIKRVSSTCTFKCLIWLFCFLIHDQYVQPGCQYTQVQKVVVELKYQTKRLRLQILLSHYALVGIRVSTDGFLSGFKKNPILIDFNESTKRISVLKPSFINNPPFQHSRIIFRVSLFPDFLDLLVFLLSHFIMLNYTRYLNNFIF